MDAGFSSMSILIVDDDDASGHDALVECGVHRFADHPRLVVGGHEGVDLVGRGGGVGRQHLGTWRAWPRPLA